MRWLSFYILAYLVLGLQVGLRPFVAWRGAMPDLMLLAVVFVCINASRQSALLGAFILGALQDLFTQSPMGLYAFSYGLVAVCIVRVQLVVYRQHPLTHITMAFAGGAICAVMELLWQKLNPTLAGASPRGIAAGAGSTIFLGLVYTVLLSPVVIGLLQRRRRWFGFQPGVASRLMALRSGMR